MYTFSVVVPAYNEKEVILETLEDIFRYFQRREDLELKEVIVVDDGSVDGTSDVVDQFYGGRVRVIRFEENQGKGAVVRAGILAAQGDFVVVMDADNSLPIQNLDNVFPFLNEYEIILPSRKYLPEYNAGLIRKVGNKIFSWYVNWILRLGVQDPQCGFKVFRREAILPCVKRLNQKRWVYDSELLFLAKREGLRVKEVPVIFQPASRPSRLRVLKSAPAMFGQIILIRLTHSKIDKWFFLFFLVLLLGLFPFYGHFWFFPHRYLPVLHEDAVKNFFTFGYHIKWDKSYWDFTGFNYPYGELVFFTDANPFLSNFLKVLKNIFPVLGEYSIEVYFLYLLFSFFICYILIYIFLRRLGVENIWSGLGAFVTTYLSPQWFRVVSHYALATSWIIPAAYFLLLKEGQNRGKKYDKLGLFFIALIGYYTHPYLGLLVTLIGGAWWGLSLFTNGLKRSYWKTLFFTFFPLLIFYGHVRWLDCHPNRFPNPWGFYANQAQFETVFLPVTGPISKWITWSGRPWEGWAYVGLVTDIVILYLLFRAGRKLYLSQHLKVISRISFIGSGIPRVLWKLSLVGVVLLFFSFGVGFNLSPRILDFFGPLKHFRSLGRFSWGFYYIAIPFAIVVLDRVFRALSKYSFWKRTLLLILIFAFYSVEGMFNHIYLQGYCNTEVSNNQFSQPSSVLQKIIHTIRTYEVKALLPLPFSQNGSELFSSHADSMIFTDQFLISYHTGVPMMNTISSRVSISEVEQFYRLISPLREDREKALREISLDDTLVLLIDVKHLRPVEWDFLTSIRLFRVEKISPYLVGFTTFRNLRLSQDLIYPSFSSQWIVQQRDDTFSVSPNQDFPLMEVSDSLWQKKGKFIFEYQIYYDSIFQKYLLPPLMVLLEDGEKQFVDKKSDMAIKGKWIYTNSYLKSQNQSITVIMHHIVPKSIRLTGIKLYCLPFISEEEGLQILKSYCLKP